MARPPLGPASFRLRAVLLCLLLVHVLAFLPCTLPVRPGAAKLSASSPRGGGRGNKRPLARRFAGKGFGANKQPPIDLDKLASSPKFLQVQMKAFERIMNEEGKVMNDVYVRAPGGAKFFFAGKVVFRKDRGISLDQAVQMQKRIIADHGRRLSPGMPFLLQFFTAPGDTEVAVAKSEERLYRALAAEAGDRDSRAADVSGLSFEDVGFMPELYEDGAQPFYCRKKPDGDNMKAPSKGPEMTPELEAQIEMERAKALAKQQAAE